MSSPRAQGTASPGSEGRVLADDEPSLQHAFPRELIRQVRALDTFGAWEQYTDAALLDPFILTRARKQALPITANPDPRTLIRLRTFYNAVAARVEARTGLMGVPVLDLSSEGFGRAFVLVGRLVAVDKPLREVHRFGFPSAEKLAARGERLVDTAVQLIERFPEAART